MSWVAEFIDWHLRTEHPWDSALRLEAFALSLQGGLREMAARVTRGMFFGRYGAHDDNALVGLRVILDRTEPGQNLTTSGSSTGGSGGR